jgi:glycosyltransferase involved in cell wall biosynthesis
MRSKPAFLVLSADPPWIYALAAGLSAHGPVTCMRFFTWLQYQHAMRPQPDAVASIRHVTTTMTPGYLGRLGPVFAPYLSSIVGKERAHLRREAGAEPYVMCSYPYASLWVRDVPDDRLLYYNFDDYRLYDPGFAKRCQQMEDRLIARARLTLCASRWQTDAFMARHPDRADRIVHAPLGVSPAFLNPYPETAPLPATVGYVGTMADRLDWTLVSETARRLPNFKFHFVGPLDKGLPGFSGWQESRAAALKLPNVFYEGVAPQAKLASHYWRYSVNWMPYRPDHPFVQAASPSKIMDGLASGRPFVSTDVPEARLYPDHIRIIGNADEAAAALSAPPPPNFDPHGQIAFAAGYSTERRAESLLALLSRHGSP